MIKYNYNNIDNKFLENGHTMFEGDVLLRLRRLAHLEEQIKQGQLLPIDSVIQSCDTCKHLSTCRFWQEAPNNGATCKFYIEHVA